MQAISRRVKLSVGFAGVVGCWFVVSAMTAKTRGT